MEQFDVTTEHRAGAVILRLAGSAGMWSVEALESAIDAAAAQRPPLVVVELSGLEFIASLAIGQLIRLAMAQRTAGARTSAAAPTPEIERALRRCRLDALIPVFPTLDAALAPAR